MGRPTNCTPELSDAIAKTIREVVPLIAAAAEHGVPERTVMRWRQMGTDDTSDEVYRHFRQVTDQALADVQKRLVGVVKRSAFDGATTSAMWLLERMFPGEFGNRAKVEHSGSVAAALDFAFTDDPAAQDAARALLDVVIPSDVVADS